MCYDDRARPPMPPGATVPAHGEELVLTASDGNQFHAYAAVPDAPSHAEIVIYPDVRGLHQFYKELALRFAEVGVTAIAIDYFGRTAGLTPRDDSFEYGPHVQQIKLDTFSLDVHAAIKYLQEKTGKDVQTFVVGFCMGGTLALATGLDKDFRFSGLMPFYAGLSRAFVSNRTALDFATEIRYPVLGQFGGADQNIPEDKVKELDDKLDKAGVEHQIIIYPSAPHSFFDRKATDYAEASTQAWQRMLEFIKTHTN